MHKLFGVALCMLAPACAEMPRASQPPEIVAQGSCWVGVWIDKNGAVVDAQMVKSTGMANVDAACVNAILKREPAPDIIIDPNLFNPGTIRRYTVVELHWHHIPLRGRTQAGLVSIAATASRGTDLS
jgi:TonB family protein